MTTKLLFDGMTCSFQPRAALIYGLHEAILLQQLHNYLQQPKMGRVVDGKKWLRMSVEDWREWIFPFITERTIRAILGALEGTGILMSRTDLSNTPFDRTKWYTINYDALAEITDISLSKTARELISPSEEEDISSRPTEQTTISEEENFSASEEDQVAATIFLDHLRSSKINLPSTEISKSETSVSGDVVLDADKKKKQNSKRKKGAQERVKVYQDELASAQDNYAIFQSDDSVRLIAELAFRIQFPLLDPPANDKSAGALWWAPLREVCDIAGWQPGRVVQLVNGAVERIRGRVDVKAPKSLITTIKTMVAEQVAVEQKPDLPWTPSGYGTDHTVDSGRWNILRPGGEE